MTNDDDACVDEWRRRLGDEPSVPTLIRAFERAFCGIWGRARITLGDVTLFAIGDRVLHGATERHPLLREVLLEPSGISCDDLQRRAHALELRELDAAVRYVLIEFLQVLGRLTAGVLTPPLHAALSDDRCDEEAPE